MSQHKNCESAVSQWLVDALSLGDERLIKAVLPLSGTPSKVEEYYLYKHIKSGNISALKALLENFPISLSSQSLRCFTSDNFVRENEAGLALREDVFSLLMEHDLDAVFARIARVRNHTSLPKVMKLKFDGIGIDSSVDLNNALKKATGYVQGNFDETLLLQDNETILKYEIQKWLSTIEDPRGWVCGLGHGIIKTTPTKNVKMFVEMVRNYYS